MVESLQTKVIKGLTGATRWGNGRALLAEVGWGSMKREGWKRKLGLMNRMRGEGVGKMVKGVGRVRRKDVKNGDKSGFFGEMHGILKELGWEEEFWEDEMRGKGEWKKVVGEKLDAWEKREWKIWRKGQGGAENNYIGGTKRKWGMERFLLWKNKKRIAFLIIG